MNSKNFKRILSSLAASLTVFSTLGSSISIKVYAGGGTEYAVVTKLDKNENPTELKFIYGGIEGIKVYIHVNQNNYLTSKNLKTLKSIIDISEVGQSLLGNDFETCTSPKIFENVADLNNFIFTSEDVNDISTCINKDGNKICSKITNVLKNRNNGNLEKYLTLEEISKATTQKVEEAKKAQKQAEEETDKKIKEIEKAHLNQEKLVAEARESKIKSKIWGAVSETVTELIETAQGVVLINTGKPSEKILAEALKITANLTNGEITSELKTAAMEIENTTNEEDITKIAATTTARVLAKTAEGKTKLTKGLENIANVIDEESAEELKTAATAIKNATDEESTATAIENAVKTLNKIVVKKGTIVEPKKASLYKTIAALKELKKIIEKVVNAAIDYTNKDFEEKISSSESLDSLKKKTIAIANAEKKGLISLLDRTLASLEAIKLASLGVIKKQKDAAILEVPRMLQVLKALEMMKEARSPEKEDKAVEKALEAIEAEQEAIEAEEKAEEAQKKAEAAVKEAKEEAIKEAIEKLKSKNKINTASRQISSTNSGETGKKSEVPAQKQNTSETTEAEVMMSKTERESFAEIHSPAESSEIQPTAKKSNENSTNTLSVENPDSNPKSKQTEEVNQSTTENKSAIPNVTRKPGLFRRIWEGIKKFLSNLPLIGRLFKQK